LSLKGNKKSLEILPAVVKYDITVIRIWMLV